MDVLQIFNDELQSLVDIKPPVSKAKMGLITRAAMKGVKFYKHIVQSVEKFIAKCGPEYKVPGLYVIDSIVRQSRHQFGVERDVYAARFARNLETTFNHLLTGCLPDEKPKIVRVLNLWQKNGVFNSQTIIPLLDLANSNSVNPDDLSAASPSSSLDNVSQGQTSKYSMHHFNNSSTSSSSRHQRSADVGLKFSKSMLDFEYDDDDDDDGDETPTEAEPPLSSTLSKIEMEQRGRRTELSNNNSVHQSSQSHSMQQYQHSDQQQHQQPYQDPVLERWKRLVRQQSIASEDLTGQHLINQSRAHRSRSRSPPTSSQKHPAIAPRTEVNHSMRERETKTRDNREQETSISQTNSLRQAEREAERQRKCLPPIRDKHLTVCSSTLWLGHVPKTVSEADVSDAFGEFGAITSIDLIPPRGCAYVCMDRRQDAKRALSESRDLKLNGSHIKMAWAPGKGFKEYRKLKDFWEADTGSSFIPYSKVDDTIDFDVLEEGGAIDEDSMSMEMRERRERKTKEKELKAQNVQPNLSLPLPTMPILGQPTHSAAMPPFSIPPPNLSIPPPSVLSQGVIPFPPPSVTNNSNQIPPSTNPDHVTSEADHDNRDGLKSPSSIDQQLSITERQISMVEQQLNLIQAQSIGQAPPTSMQPMHHPQAIFHQNQPNPMIFDMPSQPQLLHGQPTLLDPQHLALFPNPTQLLGQAPPMLPISQTNLGDPSSMNGNQLPHFPGRF